MNRILLPILAALAMSVGWGFRGDYGHEWGAMVPGALLGLSICLASGREDWWKRASLLATLGAIGWAFGGKMSYAMVVGYTASTAFPDVLYGYACLFAIGALWAGIGAAFLGLGVTRPRSYFDAFAWPLPVIYVVWKCLDVRLSGVLEDRSITGYLMHHWNLFWERHVAAGEAPAWFHYQAMNHDTSWVAATAALVVGVLASAIPRTRRAGGFIVVLTLFWWLGLTLLVGVLGLRMTPPRSDNWAGVLGLFIGLVLYLLATRNWAALLLTCYGLLAGGIGFAVTDFPNVLGRAQWGPIGEFEMLHNLDYWKWMEQGFGLVMGLGVGLGFVRILRGDLAPPEEDTVDGPMSWLALLFLLVVMMWENLFKNVRNWKEHHEIAEALFGIAPYWWFTVVGVAVTGAIILAIILHRLNALSLAPRSVFGRAQLLFLLILWIAVIAAFMQAFGSMKTRGTLLVHTTFWLTAAACTMIVLSLRERPEPVTSATPAESRSWVPPRWRYLLYWICMAAMIWLLADRTLAAHKDKKLYGSHSRFESSSKAETAK